MKRILYNLVKRRRNFSESILDFRNLSIPALLFFFLPFLFNNSAAQNGLCDSAIEINYANMQSLKVHAGGVANPLLSMPHAKGKYFEKPHLVVWFTFVVPEDTTLTFNLIPTNHTDDLDFLLFKDPSGNFCNSIRQNKRPVPVRANIASNAYTTSGRTGLSDSAIHNLEAPGKHPAFSRSLEVKKGERYYLAVDDYTKADGTFELYLNLHFPAPKKPPVQPPPPPSAKIIRPLPSPPLLKITVTDSLNAPVKARIKMMREGSGFRYRLIADTSEVSSFEKEVSIRQHLKIICIGEGYLLNQTELTIPDTATVIHDTVRLSSIKEHRRIVLQDIEFEPEMDVFLPSAAEPLSDLLSFMQKNPGIHVLIKGYVNDPFTQNSGNYDMLLSERRAKAVMKYLTDHSIDKSRMDWKGFGNSDMLYPKPQTMEQQRANRRVEIEIEP